MELVFNLLNLLTARYKQCS